MYFPKNEHQKASNIYEKLIPERLSSLRVWWNLCNMRLSRNDFNDLELVSALMEGGADVCSLDNQGSSPLRLAARK